MDEVTVKINTPKDISSYGGQFVVFFSDEKDPEILFNSYFAEEAYGKADEISKKEGKVPTVYRVQDNDVNLVTKIFA